MSNSQDLPQDQKETSTVTPGNSLRRLRKETDISVDAVAAATKISITNIRAIEKEHYEKLPADTFVRGQVTLYGNFLGTNGSKIAAEFLAEREKTCPAAGRHTQIKKSIYSSSLTPGKLAEPSHISSATIALILLAGIILSFSGFCLYTSWNPLAFLSQQTENMQTSMQGIFSSNEQQEPDDATTALPQQKQQPPPRPKGETTEKYATGITGDPQADATGQQFPYNLTALILRDCEVVIRIDGRNPIRKSFKKGEVARWRAADSLQVIFDKTKAANLTLNDTALAFPMPNGSQRPTLLLPNDILPQ